MSSVNETRTDSSDSPPTGETERRLLTIIFCDLVGSTHLSTLLDPEDLSEVYIEIRAIVSRLIADLGGHLAGFQGDGIIAFFGYPIAHENDPHRAVEAAVEIMASLRKFRHRCLTDDQALHLRISVHTGIAIVGDLGEGQSRERMGIVGEAPNVAARLQSLADPDTVVISAATARIVAQQFECKSLGRHGLKGLDREIEVFEVIGKKQIPPLVGFQHGVTHPISGRQYETTLLLEHWAKAHAGTGQVVIVRGEGGVGKSRLLSAFIASFGEKQPVVLVCQGSPLREMSSLLPIIEMTRRLLRLEDTTSSEVQLERLRDGLAKMHLPVDDLVPIIAPLLGVYVEGSEQLTDLSPALKRRRLLRAIVDALIEGTKRVPILLLVEDVHWLDSSTLEVIGDLITLSRELPLMLVGTLRPEFMPPWLDQRYVQIIDLGPVGADAGKAIAEAIPGASALPSGVIEALLKKAEGIPLFIEELTRSALETPANLESDLTKSGTALPHLVPAILHSTLLARLDRLGDAKAVCQVASVIGVTFSYDLLLALDAMPETRLRNLLAKLIGADLIHRVAQSPKETYVFRHSLLRDAVYESLLVRRRRWLHKRIGELLEGQFPDICEVEPEAVAHHFMFAGASEKSITWWESAARRASRQAAYVEAIAHLQQALTLLQSLPVGLERDRWELKLRMALGGRFLASKGNAAPEVYDAFDRTRQLSESIGDLEALFGSMRGLQFYSINRGSLEVGRDMGEQMLRLAERIGQPTFLREAHRPLGLCQFFMGDLSDGLRHLSTTVKLYEIQAERPQHLDYGIESATIALSNLAWLEHFLGHEEDSIAHCRRALDHSAVPSDPYSRAFALGLAASIYQCRGEPAVAMAFAEEVLALATDHAYPYWIAWARILRGWSSVRGSGDKHGLTELLSGLEIHESTGAQQMLPYFLTLLGEVFSKLGAFDEASRTLEKAIAAAERTSLRFYEAESHRLAAEVARRRGEPDAAVQGHLRQSFSLATRQGSDTLMKLVVRTAHQLYGDQALALFR